MLRLLLLGEPALLKDSEPVPLPARHWAIALLSYLARSPGATSTRSVVAALLWPESSERSARLSLRQALFRLRREAAETLRSHGEALCLDPAQISVDASEFEALLSAGQPERALHLYRGAFLDGFALPRSTSFDHWADRERSYFAGRAAGAFKKQVEALSSRGDWSTALEWAERWLAAAPFSDSAARHLVSIHAQQGDWGSALAAYEAFRSRMEKELGLSPAAELKALASQLRKAPFRSAPSIRPSARGEVSRSDAPFVGRAEEFARLSTRWERARAGRPQFMLLTGEVGIGKTRLASEFARWARLSGGTVLTGRAYEVEDGAIPYTALVSALRSGLHAPGLAAVDDRTLAELGRILPELANRFGGAFAPTGDDAEVGRLRLLDAVRTFVDNLAYEAPVLLFLDDLPWTDAASVAALHHVWRSLPEAPLLFLATARSGDLQPEGPAGRLLAALLRDHGEDVEEIELPLLAPAEVERIVAVLSAGAIDNRVAIGALEAATGGNPLFLVEALRARAEGDGDIPATATVRSVVRDRLRRLSPHARDLLGAASVLGRRFPFPTAAAVASLSTPEAVAALAELVEARITQEVGYGYDFTHDLVRRTVYEDLSAARRRILHERAYERQSPAEGEAVGIERAGMLAMHAIAGGLREQGFRWLLRASELATRAYADVESELYLEQARTLADTRAELAEAWERTAHFHRIRSRFREAARNYLRALHHTASGTRERLLLRVRALDASARAGVLDAADIRSAAAELAPEAEAYGGTPLLELCTLLAQTGVQTGDLEAAAPHAAAALQPAREDGPRSLVRALLLHARLGVATGAVPNAVSVLEEAARVAADHGLVVEQSQAEIECAGERMRLGRWGKAARELEEVLHRAEAVGDLSSEVTAALNLGDLRLRRGEWEAADALLQRVELAGERFPHLLLYARINRALMAWLRGDFEGMARLASEVVDAAPALQFRPVEQLARALRVVGRIEMGGAQDVAEDIHAIEEVDASALSFWPLDREMVVLAKARAMLLSGDAPAAVSLLERGQQINDCYGAAVLQLELASVLTTHHPGRAEHLRSTAERALGELGAAPLLQRYQNERAARPVDDAAQRSS